VAVTNSQQKENLEEENKDFLNLPIIGNEDDAKVLKYNKSKIIIWGSVLIIIALITYLFLPKELAYQSAEKDMANGNKISALNTFVKLGSYRESVAYTNQIKIIIYNEGIECYHKDDYLQAAKDFLKIINYKQSKYYLTLMYIKLFSAWDSEDKNTIEAHRLLLSSKDKIGHLDKNTDIIKTLKENLQFEDTKDVIMDSQFAEYFLEGSWENGDDYFTVTNRNGVYDLDLSAKDPKLMWSDWWTSYNIPWFEGEGYKIEKGIYWMGSDKSGWKEQYKITIKSINEINLYCFKNYRTYALHRM